MNIEVDGLNINYKISGEGDESIVILQGWGTTLEVYDAMAKVLSEKYKVIQLDFPGFGKSDEPKESLSVSEFSDFTLKFFEKINLKKASLIGHSYGGRVIITLASRDNIPFEIDRIVLVDSAGVMPKKTFLKKLKTYKYKLIKSIVNIDFIYKICPDLIDTWRSSQGSSDYRNATPVMRGCLVKAVNEDLTHLFPKIDKEVLLIWGDKDTATPIEDAKVMEEKMPNAGLAVIKGCGHYSFLENQPLFNSIIKSYFKIA